MGRELGYPTANLQYTDPDKIHLGHGVYAVQVKVRDLWLKGMLSIGTRPTLNDVAEKIEVHIFDFDEAIYGEKLTVSVLKFLRYQEKYQTLDALINQLAIDKQNALAAFNHFQ